MDGLTEGILKDQTVLVQQDHQIKLDQKMLMQNQAQPTDLLPTRLTTHKQKKTEFNNYWYSSNSMYMYLFI